MDRDTFTMNAAADLLAAVANRTVAGLVESYSRGQLQAQIQCAMNDVWDTALNAKKEDTDELD